MTIIRDQEVRAFVFGQTGDRLGLVTAALAGLCWVASAASGGVTITYLAADSYETGGYVQEDVRHFRVTQNGQVGWSPPTNASSSKHLSSTDTLGPAFFSADVFADHLIAATSTSLMLDVVVHTSVLSSVAVGWPEGQAEGFAYGGAVAADFTLTKYPYFYMGDNTLNVIGSSGTFPSGTVLSPGVYSFSRTFVGPFTSIKAHDGETKSVSDVASRHYRFIQCGADFNGNGFINGDDFDSFTLAFVAGNLAADFNGDGFVNGDDYDGFVDAFEVGC